MDLVLRRGPLEPAALDAIARLYGPFNRKYADPQFCGRLFNDTPRGPSLHGFLVVLGGAIVGHYAVIPMDVLARGERRLSGKGEAFVVHPDHRRETVSLGGRPVLCGPALQLAVVREALERGTDVVHMIAPGAVGLIHRMIGCTAVANLQVRSALVLRPGDPDGGAAGGGNALRHALARGQRPASALARRFLAGGSRSIRRWSVDALPRDRLERIAADLPQPPGWSLAIDSAALTWMARAAGLELFAADDDLSSWALVTRRAGDGRSTEVLAWRERGGPRTALRLLAAILDQAEDQAASIGVPHAAAPVPEERERLRSAARVLLLRERAQDAGLYVQSRDPYYGNPRHLTFTPFYYGIY